MSAHADTADGPPWRDADLLRTLYIEEDFGQRDLARRWNCAQSTIDKWLDRYDISKQRDEKPWTDPDRLRELYHGEGLVDREIAARWECSASTISAARKRHGIEPDPEDKQRTYTEGELIGHLQALDADSEYRPTKGDINDADGPSYATYRQRFGTIDAALEAAGIDPDAPTCDAETDSAPQRSSLNAKQGTILQAQYRAARELLRVEDPFRVRDTDLSDSAFRKFIAVGILQHVDDQPTLPEPGANTYSHRWETADGVRGWIRDNVTHRGECPHPDCASGGIHNAGDGEFTCTNPDCPETFGEQTALEVVGE